MVTIDDTYDDWSRDDDPMDLEPYIDDAPEHFPQDDQFLVRRDAQDELEYRDGVVERLLDNVDEYLSFATARDLIKLLGDNL